MKIKIQAQIVIRDKNNKIIRVINKNCKSYVRQFIDGLRSSVSNLATTLKDTSGTERSAIISWRVDSGAGVVTHGIRVGTGINAVTISDFNLQTSIAHGSGAGQLMHGLTSVGLVSLVGSTAKFTVSRTFTNDSGDTITIKEVGLICYSLYAFLLERSLLEFEIANTESGTVTYTISVTV